RPNGITIDDSVADEGDTGSRVATFRLTRPFTSVGAATVDWKVQRGSAGAADLDETTGKATFGPNDTAVNIQVPFRPNRSVQAPRQFTVTLSNPQNTTI